MSWRGRWRVRLGRSASFSARSRRRSSGSTRSASSTRRRDRPCWMGRRAHSFPRRRSPLAEPSIRRQRDDATRRARPATVGRKAHVRAICDSRPSLQPAIAQVMDRPDPAWGREGDRHDRQEISATVLPPASASGAPNCSAIAPAIRLPNGMSPSERGHDVERQTRPRSRGETRTLMSVFVVA